MTDHQAEVKPHKPKSPGRVAAAKRLNELGLAYRGGVAPTHGLRALEAMLGRGEAPPGKVGQLLAEHEGHFLADLGGREHASAMEQGLCRRLAETELLLALVKARLTTEGGTPRGLPWERQKDLLMVHARLADSYTRTATALGLKRREVDPLEIHVTRYVPQAPPQNGGNGDQAP